jgi:hypothetical protein
MNSGTMEVPTVPASHIAPIMKLSVISSANVVNEVKVTEINNNITNRF